MDDSLKFKYKIEIIDIFPTLEEITQNNIDKITLEIPLLKEEIILNDLLISKNKNLIAFNDEVKSLNFIISKNNNPFAGTNATLIKGSQWITFKYENPNNVNNNNNKNNRKNSLALSLIDCIKIKIFYSDFNSDSHNISINNNNNNYKKHTQLFSDIS